MVNWLMWWMMVVDVVTLSLKLIQDCGEEIYCKYSDFSSHDKQNASLILP